MNMTRTSRSGTVLSADPERNLRIRDVLRTEDEISLKQAEIDELSSELTMPQDDIRTWVQALNRKNQTVFYGPPGTGKTYAARKFAEKVTEDTSNIWDIVQFHQSYEYEDFIQGLRPKTDTVNLQYSLEPGKFLQFCKGAEKRADPCILIIDEINRADLSAVFGELMYLLEYRDEEMDLAQNTSDDDPFKIPKNVYLMGTMNTADRSIALVDFALRRRFGFIPFYPESYKVLKKKFDADGIKTDELIDHLKKINDEIDDQHYSVGFTYFLNAGTKAELKNIWKLEIEPYLEEYFIDDPETVDNFRWDKVETRISE